jgi:hypothetical protein
VNPKHSSASCEWYTPAPIVEAARALMGGITLDPATSPKANETVRAQCALYHGGLETRWREDDPPHKVWLNPPGGKTGGKSNTRLFWEKLTLEWSQGEVEQAVFLAFSMEALQMTQDSPMPMARFPLCIPSKRIRFLSPGGIPQTSPTHGNAIVYLPPGQGARGQLVRRFVDRFSPFGAVLVPSDYV